MEGFGLYGMIYSEHNKHMEGFGLYGIRYSEHIYNGKAYGRLWAVLSNGKAYGRLWAVLRYSEHMAHKLFQEISGSSVIAEQGAAILVRRARSNSTTGHVSEQMVLSAVLS